VKNKSRALCLQSASIVFIAAEGDETQLVKLCSLLRLCQIFLRIYDKNASIMGWGMGRIAACVKEADLQ
jgi:hypothetical protein